MLNFFFDIVYIYTEIEIKNKKEPSMGEGSFLFLIS